MNPVIYYYYYAGCQRRRLRARRREEEEAAEAEAVKKGKVPVESFPGRSAMRNLSEDNCRCGTNSKTP